jgi:hypothetical protein
MNKKASTRPASRHLCAALYALAAICLALPAYAQDWKVTGEFGWFGVGKAFEIEKNHYYWVGEFSGTFFNEKGAGSLFHLAGVKCPAYNDLNFNTNKSSGGGYCIITDLEGDQAFLTWRIPTGGAAPGSKNPGTFEYTGGTGKYKDIRGSNNFSGITQVNWADGTASGYAIWNR